MLFPKTKGSQTSGKTRRSDMELVNLEFDTYSLASHALLMIHTVDEVTLKAIQGGSGSMADIASRLCSCFHGIKDPCTSEAHVLAAGYAEGRDTVGVKRSLCRETGTQPAAFRTSYEDRKMHGQAHIDLTCSPTANALRMNTSVLHETRCCSSMPQPGIKRN